MSEERADESRFTDEQARASREAIAWFSRLRSSRVSAEDRRVFEEWRERSPAHARAFQLISEMWEDPALKAAAVQSAQALLPARRRPRWLTAAVVTAVFSVLVVVAAHQFDLMTRIQADYYTVTGERRTIQLPDQSTVTLNTQTAISTAFDQDARRVQLLKGEALFKVHSDQQRPFMVEHHQIVSRAIGTEFVVQARSEGIQVTVVEGVVEVNNKNQARPGVRLGAGTQIRVDQGVLSEPHPVDPVVATSWLRGRLVVNAAQLADVIDDLRRYYPGTIIIWNPDIARIQVTGTYDLADPSGILATLGKTLPIRTVSLADRVVVLF